MAALATQGPSMRRERAQPRRRASPLAVRVLRAQALEPPPTPTHSLSPQHAPKTTTVFSNPHPTTHSDPSLSLATADWQSGSTMKFSAPALLATLVPVALADVKFVSVNEGDVLTVGYGPKPITVEWVESGRSPKVSDLDTYELDLCAGTNDNFASIKTISKEGRFSQGNTAEGVISPSDGGDTVNAYFFRIVSTTKDGKTITNYSPRFSLRGMSGKFPESIAESLKASVLDVSSPGDLNHFELRQQVGGAAAAASESADASYLLAYTLQTGLTRYAPMQKVPGSTITKSQTTRLYPTSAFSKYTTFGKSPDAQMTVTQSQTYSHSSIEATQSAAPNPTDDMAKFLARWKD